MPQQRLTKTEIILAHPKTVMINEVITKINGQYRKVKYYVNTVLLAGPLGVAGGFATKEEFKQFWKERNILKKKFEVEGGLAESKTDG